MRETTPDPTPIRAAVRQALADHAPVGKTYPDGKVTKHCRCGLATDGSTLTPRTQHLEDVITAAVEAVVGRPGGGT